MENDLAERYIYAATKNLPAKTRKDIENELRSLIDDMLMERCGKFRVREEDVMEVLTELGPPAELGEKYSPDGDKCLIGPPYYRKYKALLKFVLPAVAFGMTVSGIVTTLMDPTAVWYLAALTWLSTTLLGLVYAFAIITVLFAAFQRYNAVIRTDDDEPLKLPPVPKENEAISKWEPLVGIALTVVFFVVFLIAPQVVCVGLNGNTIIPIFDTEKIRELWYIILAFAMLGITREGFKLYERRYSKKLAIVTVVTDVCAVVLSFIFLLDSKIINSNFIPAVAAAFKKEEPFLMPLFSKINLLFLAIILFALTLDMATTIVKTKKFTE